MSEDHVTIREFAIYQDSMEKTLGRIEASYEKLSGAMEKTCDQMVLITRKIDETNSIMRDSINEQKHEFNSHIKRFEEYENRTDSRITNIAKKQDNLVDAFNEQKQVTRAVSWIFITIGSGFFVALGAYLFGFFN